MGQDSLKPSEVKVYLTKKVDGGTEVPVLEPTKISNLETSKFAKLIDRDGSLKLADIIEEPNKETTYQYKLKVNVDSRLKWLGGIYEKK